MAIARPLHRVPVRSSRSLRSTILIAVALIASVLVVLAPGAADAQPPVAEPPVAQPLVAKPSVADIEQQIDTANNKLEPVIEDYNRVHTLLAQNKKQADALAQKLEPLQLEASVASARIQPLALQAYEHGLPSTTQALIDADSTTSLLNRLSLFRAVADVQHDQIASTLAIIDRYSAAKSKLDAAVAALSAQNADLSGKKKSIETQIAALQKLRQQVGGGDSGSLRPAVCPYTYIGGAAGVAVRTACSEIGKPYVWAAAGPNTFDCSGLTLYAWGKAGKTLRHYTKWQWEDTTPVSRADLRPGDLVFFFPPSLHHVGIYVGGGWMVHAPHTGDVVRMAKIDGNDPIAGFRRP